MPDEYVTIGINADVSRFKKAIDDMKKSVKGVGSKVRGQAKESSDASKETEQSQKKVGTLIAQNVLSQMSFAKSFNGLGKSVDGIKASFKEAGATGKVAMAGVGLAVAGAVAGAVIMIVQAVWDGVKKLVSVADPIGFEKVMSGVNASVNKLKSALGNALMPLFLEMSIAIKYIAEGLTLIIEGIIYIRSLLFGLLGINIAEEMQKVADSMEDASESATQGLAGFDKLNTIGDMDVSGLKESERIAELTQDAYEMGQMAQLNLGKWVGEMAGKIGGFWNSITKGATSLWNSVKTSVSNLWNSFTTIITNGLDTIWNTLTSVFSSIGSTIGKTFNSLWDGLTGGFKGVANSFIKVLNGIVDAYNKTIGNIRVDNDFLGIHIGFPKMSNIPMLAQGGVIEPRDPHLVMVGDNTREREVVSPISTIEQAVSNVLSRGEFGGNQKVDLTVNLDGRTIARQIYDPMRQEARRRGRPNAF